MHACQGEHPTRKPARLYHRHLYLVALAVGVGAEEGVEARRIEEVNLLEVEDESGDPVDVDLVKRCHHRSNGGEVKPSGHS